MYNTAGTNMLCAALKRRTGEDLFEYLTPRLFEPLGIENIECFRLPDGIEMGGAGSRLKTEDMARFILFVSRHGKWRQAAFERRMVRHGERKSGLNDQSGE